MPSEIDLNEPPLFQAFDEEDYSYSIDLNQPAGGDMGEEVILSPLNEEDILSPLNEEPETGLDLESSMQQETEEAFTQQASTHHQTFRNRLSTSERTEILLWLLERTTEGKLHHGAINAAAQHFGVSRKSIGKIWGIAKTQREHNIRYNLTTRYHMSGRKRIQVPVEAITALNMGERSCIRDLATNISTRIKVSKSTIHRMIKRRVIKPHTNPLHPGLKPANMLARLKWILSMIPGNTPEAKTHYKPMYDYVHIDEKWFNLSKKTQRVYLAHDEKGKYRSANSSKFIPKVMFTAAVARPRYNAQGECIFDGKIGIFPFAYKEPAKRSSKNRQKGTVVTKLVESINRSVTRDMLINQIVPAIKAKWPQEDGQHKIIFIQQDNAKAHITQEDAQWQQVCEQEGFTFILVQQPPNSPDLNILDLGFFRSIQSLMHKKMPKDVDDMLSAVYDAYYELEPKTLSDVWMTLQYCMNEIMKHNGGNDYDIPHVGKKRLARQGILQSQVETPMHAVLTAWELIHGGQHINSTEASSSNAAQYTQDASQEFEEEEDYIQ